ncbi:VOC family protein [Sphingomonas alpina]|uniref:VOC family protein n=1 Tax=Sphingomonas alpina TaxID=653931 RepID=A0A7H0LPL8_9SPHN|nr:VOC family protein [Sphingomonas alpina]QNQ11621.1 VOC family protein [Sphingomonas alpina]
MFSHITLGSSDIDRSRAFYEPVMTALGIGQPFQLDQGLVFGELAGPKLFIGAPFDGGAPHPGNGPHTALLAPDRAAVDAFHAAALTNGGSDEGIPGLRPHYHANYYGAYVRDPDGNKLQAVCHRKYDDTAA